MMCPKIINQSGFTLIEIIATVVILAAFSAITLMLFSASSIKSSGNVMRISKSSDISNVMANIYADYKPYPIWKASTSYAVGNKVFPAGMNGRFYICNAVIGDNLSSASEPQWFDSGSTSDNHVTWNAGVWVASTPYTAGAIVIPVTPNGHFYRCITGGTSGAMEPTWLLKDDASFTDGSVTWKRLLRDLSDKIGTPDHANKKNNNWYGQYYVLENRFVKFVNNAIQTVSAGDPQNVLEVKIQSVGKNPDGTDCPGEQILTTLFTAKEN